MNKIVLTAVAAVFATVTAGNAIAADWAPSGPITMNIAYKAGGGADTQGRLLAEEIEARKGWKIIPGNITGKGGANMARAMLDAPADGTVIGVAVTETFTYGPLVDGKSGYTAEDFTFISTTAPTQMGVVARADKGWKSLDDMAAAAKAGNVSFSSMSPRLTDGAAFLSIKYGIDLNIVSVKGGKGSLNAIIAEDVDVGWVAGIQAKDVKAGDLVNLASAESTRLAMSPDAPTLAEIGIPYDFGAKFVVIGPKGMPDEARNAISAAIADILNDPESKTAQFIRKTFGEPLILQGAELDAFTAKEISDNEALLKALE